MKGWEDGKGWTRTIQDSDLNRTVSSEYDTLHSSPGLEEYLVRQIPSTAALETPDSRLRMGEDGEQWSWNCRAFPSIPSFLKSIITEHTGPLTDTLGHRLRRE